MFFILGSKSGAGSLRSSRLRVLTRSEAEGEEKIGLFRSE
jgi:hypothetical protein